MAEPNSRRGLTLLRPLKGAVCTTRLKVADTPRVLLTFDDGPHPETTPAILALLQRYRARAVFFVVGSRIGRAPGMLREILGQGHLLGNHSFAHHLDTAPTGLVAYCRDIARAQSDIERACGMRPRLFRPPLGHLSIASLAASRLLSLRMVLWSIDASDWRMRHSDDVAPTLDCLLNVLERRPLHDIVLLHDETVHSVTLLESLLPALESRGIDLYDALEFL